MVYRMKCGEGLPLDAAYCRKCGEKVIYEPKLDPGFNRNFRTAWIDNLGFGVFLLVVAWMVLEYPFFWGEFISWLKSVSGEITMIPISIVEPAAVFLTIMGAWGIANGVIRGFIGDRYQRAVNNNVSGCFNFALVYFLLRYASGTLASSFIIPTFVIFIGLSIIASGLVNGLMMDHS